MCSEDETISEAGLNYHEYICTVEKMVFAGVLIPAHTLTIKYSTLATDRLRMDDYTVKTECLIHSIPRYRLNTDKLIP